MRICRIVPAALFLVPAPLCAEVQSPEQIWGAAYRCVREAKAADFGGRREVAERKYREARELLQGLARSHPDWNRDAVWAQRGEISRWFGASAPRAGQAFELSVEESRGLAGTVEEIGGAKLALARQMEWERRKLYDIEKLARDFARKEGARRILGKEQGEAITAAEMRRAEELAAQPAPETVEEARRKEEGPGDLALLDTDGDGLSDADEINLGTDPTKEDTDGDGLSDEAEVNIYKTDPLDPDTDGDGDSDGEEVEEGWDPLEPPPWIQ